jgi:hypothetical protein
LIIPLELRQVVQAATSDVCDFEHDSLERGHLLRELARRNVLYLFGEGHSSSVGAEAARPEGETHG